MNFGAKKEEVEALRAEVTFLREAVEEVRKHAESAQPEGTESVMPLMTAAEVEERSQARFDKITGWNNRLAARLDTVETDVVHVRDDVATLLGEVSELAGNLTKMESRLKAVFKGLTS